MIQITGYYGFFFLQPFLHPVSQHTSATSKFHGCYKDRFINELYCDSVTEDVLIKPRDDASIELFEKPSYIYLNPKKQALRY